MGPIGIFFVSLGIGYSIWGGLINMGARNLDMWSRMLGVSAGVLLMIVFLVDKSLGDAVTKGEAYFLFVAWCFAGGLAAASLMTMVIEYLDGKGMLPSDQTEEPPQVHPGVAEPPAEYKVKEPTPEEKLAEILRRNRRE